MENLQRFEEINQKIYSNKLIIADKIVGACDLNWLKEFEHHYCNSPYCYPYVTRVELMNDAKNWMGFVNIRNAPAAEGLASELSECYLKPPEEMVEDKNTFLNCLNTYYEYGKQVECVPFIMPEGTLNVCAQASTWICLKIIENLSNRSIRSKDMPAIQSLATGVPWSDGAGLTLNKVARLLHVNQCGTFYFNSLNTPLSEEDLVNTVYAYVESGLPVILGVDVSKLDWWETHEPGNHAVVVIGHTMSNEGNITGFILHDESMLPYVRITKESLLKAWRAVEQKDQKKVTREAVMNVPPLVLIPFETAYNMISGIITEFSRLDIQQAKYHVRPLLIHQDELISRLSDFFKNKPHWKLIEYGINEREEIPDYVWAFLLHKSGSLRFSQEPDGVILVDATTYPNVVLISVPQKTLMVSTDNEFYDIFFDEQQNPKKELQA